MNTRPHLGLDRPQANTQYKFSTAYQNLQMRYEPPAHMHQLTLGGVVRSFFTAVASKLPGVEYPKRFLLIHLHGIAGESCGDILGNSVHRHLAKGSRQEQKIIRPVLLDSLEPIKIISTRRLYGPSEKKTKER